MIDPHAPAMRSDIVKQLEDIGINSNAHNTLRELKRKLAVALVALDREQKCPGQDWW